MPPIIPEVVSLFTPSSRLPNLARFSDFDATPPNPYHFSRTTPFLDPVEMKAPDPEYAGLASRPLLHLTLDAQAELSPSLPAICCPNGTMTYRDLSVQSQIWATRLLERGVSAAGSVVPICMPTGSVWTVVAMYAVMRTGGAFALIDSSAGDARGRLLSLASSVCASCVVLGAAEYHDPEMASAAPHVVCMGGARLEPVGTMGDLTGRNNSSLNQVGSRRLSCLDVDNPSLAWATLERGSTSITLHRHDAVLESIFVLNPLQGKHHGWKGDMTPNESLPGLILWPFVVRHHALLELFRTIMLGGLVVVPPGNASLEDMRHVVSRYSRYQFRAFVFHEKLVSLDLPQVASRLNKIFLYDFPPAAVTTQVENGFLVLSSQDLCHGGVLITSMPSNGQRRVVASNCRVSVAAPGNTEPTTQSGVAGQLVIKDGNALAGCVVAHSPSSLEPANHTRHWQRGFLDTGLQACVDSDGALHVHHQVGTREPEVNDEDFLADSVRGYATPSRETTPSEDETPSQKPTVNVQERNTHAADPQLVLARLWADVLCVDQSTLDLDDRFIDRGGDSFKTAQLISLARAEGVELPVLELFTGNLSLQEMAAGITNNRLGRTADSNATCDLDSEAVPKGLSRGMHDDDDVEDDLSNLLGRVPLPEWLHADHVDKVLPATGWQASIAGHMTLEAQHWADCLVFDLHGPLSIDHLRTSCASLLASHEILRTVFAVAGGHALQLVVGASHYPLRFTTQQVDPAKGETLDLVTNEFWSETKRPLPPQLDRQWVRFMVVVQDAHRHRLLVRLTHGQYDAGSIPPIIQHLRFSYEKASCNSRDPLPGLTPHHPQFSSFVAWARRKPYVKAAEGFWEETLRGLGKSTTLLPQPHNGPSAATTGVEHVINERSRSPEISLDLGLLRGVMPSTVISAAWSAVLMFLTGESDVVHGMVTSGRHNAMEGIDRVVGPCWNVLPVRTRLEVSRADEQEEQTVLGLLRQVQRSQQDSLAHELLPFRHMVEKCTTWPPWTNLSSVINFENVAIPRIGGTAAPVSARQRLAPGVELEFTPMAGPVSGPTDFWVAVTPHNRPEGTGVTLELRWDNRKFARGFVDAVLRLYSEVVVVFTVDPAMPVVEAVRRAATSGLGEDGAEELRTSVACSMEFVRTALEETWTNVLACPCPADRSGRTIPYYAIRGEVIYAAALAQGIRRRLGVGITTEIVMRNPSLDMLESWLMRNVKVELKGTR